MIARTTARRLFAVLGTVLASGLVACGQAPEQQGDVGKLESDVRVKDIVECCQELFEESAECRDARHGRKPDPELWRRCQRDHMALVHNQAQCLQQGILRKGICGSPDAVTPPVVQATCGDGSTVLDGQSCGSIKEDAALAVVTEAGAAALTQRGATVALQPGLAADGHVTAEISLPVTSPLWTEIGSADLPPAVTSLKVSSPEILRSVFLALWLRQQSGVRHARPIHGMKPNAILNGITDTFYLPSSDLLATPEATLVKLRESWRVLQFASFARSEVRLAVVDGGFTTGSSDLDNPIDLGTMNEANDTLGSEWHGHWVASVAGAVGNNNTQVSGTSAFAVQGLDSMSPMPRLRVMRVHVGTFWDPELGAGIGRALDAGADIINLSFGSNCDSVCQFFGYDPVLDPIAWALGRARDEQVIAVAAAGNDGKDLNAPENFFVPCELGASLALCVGATDAAGGTAAFSNINGEVITYAPGVGIPVAASAGSPFAVGMASGTSLSAPFVAGVLTGVVASWGNVRTVIARDLIAATSSSATGIPVLDAAAAMRAVVTPARDRFEGGDFVDPIPTTNELLTLTDEDAYSFQAVPCETVEITIDHVALRDGAPPPYAQISGGGWNEVPFTVTDPTPQQRVLRAGPLDAATYTVVLGRRPSTMDPAQLPLGYTLTTRRTTGTNCENSELVGATIPATVEAGRTFFTTATFRNTGHTVWRPGTHRVVAQVGGAAFSFTQGMPVTFDVDPRESFTASLELTAPATLGTHPLQLRMSHDGVGPFGAATAVTGVTTIEPTGLDVRFDPPAGDIPPRVCLAPAIYRYTLVNQGTAAWTSDFVLQTYRHESGVMGPWEKWLASPLGRTVAPGESITLELLQDRIGVPGYWEIRAQLERGGQPIGAGSDSAFSGIGIYDNGDSNNHATPVRFVTPSGVAEGEAGLFEVTFDNTGCNPWRPSLGHYLESVAGHWSPTTIPLDESRPTPVNGTLTRTFTTAATSYDVRDGLAVNPAAWRLRTSSWTGTPTETRVIPITHAYAQCESIRVPPILTVNQEFPVVVRMKNTGGTTWTQAVGYRLGYTPPGAETWGRAYIELAPGERIEPGQTKEFRWMATAPPTPGSYPFFWMMYRDSQYFFDACGPNEDVVVQ